MPTNLLLKNSTNQIQFSHWMLSLTWRFPSLPSKSKRFAYSFSAFLSSWWLRLTMAAPGFLTNWSRIPQSQLLVISRLPCLPLILPLRTQRDTPDVEMPDHFRASYSPVNQELKGEWKDVDPVLSFLDLPWLLRFAGCSKRRREGAGSVSKATWIEAMHRSKQQNQMAASDKKGRGTGANPAPICIAAWF